MSNLHIGLAYTIIEDRFREAEDCRRINKALTVRHKRAKHPVQSLVYVLRNLMKQEPRVATEPARG